MKCKHSNFIPLKLFGMLDPHGKLIKPRNFSTNEFMTQFGYFTEIPN